MEDRLPSNRIAGIAFVALLHVAIIYALVSGLGEQVVQVLRQPLQARIIQDVKPPPAPPPPPLLAPPPPTFIPPPLVQIAQPPPPVPVIAAVTHVAPPAPPPKPVLQPAIRSGAGLDPNQSCAATTTLQNDLGQDLDNDPDMLNPDPTILQFLIAADGHVERVIVARSSGHVDLDRDAQRALAQCKFNPAIGADGKPQEAWTSIPYVWQGN